MYFCYTKEIILKKTPQSGASELNKKCEWTFKEHNLQVTVPLLRNYLLIPTVFFWLKNMHYLCSEDIVYFINYT